MQIAVQDIAAATPTQLRPAAPPDSRTFVRFRRAFKLLKPTSLQIITNQRFRVQSTAFLGMGWGN